MQIKTISLFIGSYLVISTVAAPTTPIPEEAATAVDYLVGRPGSLAGYGSNYLSFFLRIERAATKRL
jgi:hypothetical protein